MERFHYHRQIVNEHEGHIDHPDVVLAQLMVERDQMLESGMQIPDGLEKKISKLERAKKLK